MQEKGGEETELCMVNCFLNWIIDHNDFDCNMCKEKEEAKKEGGPRRT